MKALKSLWYWTFSLLWAWGELHCTHAFGERIYTWLSLISWWLDERRFDWE